MCTRREGGRREKRGKGRKEGGLEEGREGVPIHHMDYRGKYQEPDSIFITLFH